MLQRLDLREHPARVPLEWCNQQSPWLTQVKFIGSYVIPVVDVQVSSTFRSQTGGDYANSKRQGFVIVGALVDPLRQRLRQCA